MRVWPGRVPELFVDLVLVRIWASTLHHTATIAAILVKYARDGRIESILLPALRSLYGSVQ